MEERIWKEASNPNYLVSMCGLVYNKTKRKVINELLPQGYERAYTEVSFGKSRLVHRIVYETFVGPIPEGMVINHKDGVKTNNHLSNLEVCTPQENTIHAYATGLACGRKGEDHHNSILNETQIIQIYGLLRLGYSNDFIADLFNIEFKHVSLLRNGKRWKHLFERENMKVYRSFNVQQSLPEAIHIYNTCMVSKLPQEIIGKQLGIDPSQVSRIRTGRSWKHFRKHFNIPEHTPDWKDRRDALKLHVDMEYPITKAP